MRKFIYSIITSIYLLVATGVGINVHYCMGEISSVEFHDSDKKQCGKCGMEEKEGGCCSNQKQFYKYDHPSKYQDVQSFSISFCDLPVTNHVLSSIDPISLNISLKEYPEKKPDPGGPPIYLRNSVFRL